MPESWDGGVVYRSTSLTFVACRHALVFFFSASLSLSCFAIGVFIFSGSSQANDMLMLIWKLWDVWGVGYEGRI